MQHWAISSLDGSAVTNTGLVIMDPDHPGQRSTSSPQIVLASISIGEAEDDHHYWLHVASATYLLSSVSEREGHSRVDFRDPEWQRLILKVEIPRIVALGYDGLLLDHLDSILDVEEQGGAALSGQRDSLSHWLSRLRDAYPDLVILAKGSRSLEVAAAYVDAYVCEGVYTVWDGTTHKVRKTTTDERESKLKHLENALAVETRPVFTVEFSDLRQPALGKWAEGESRKRGFRPFIKIR